MLFLRYNERGDENDNQLRNKSTYSLDIIDEKHGDCNKLPALIDTALDPGERILCTQPKRHP
jgi:hypothetical protein